MNDPTVINFLALIGAAAGIVAAFAIANAISRVIDQSVRRGHK